MAVVEQKVGGPYLATHQKRWQEFHQKKVLLSSNLEFRINIWIMQFVIYKHDYSIAKKGWTTSKLQVTNSTKKSSWVIMAGK